MILSRKEFQEKYNYKHIQAVHRLVREEKIDINDKGMIDTNTAKNKDFCIKREKKINKLKKTKKTETQKNKNLKSEEQLGLDIDILNAKVERTLKQNELLGIKIAKEKGELIESDLLNKIIVNIFDSFFQALCNYPNIKADEIIDLIKSNQNPKEELIKNLTDDIISIIKDALETARKITKKYIK